MPFIPRLKSLGFSGMTYKFYMTDSSTANGENAPPPQPSPSRGEGEGGGDKTIFKVISMYQIQNFKQSRFGHLDIGAGGLFEIWGSKFGISC
jgi:hypothetical protein